MFDNSPNPDHAWSDLCAGRLSLIERHDHDGVHILIARRAPPLELRRKISALDWAIVNRARNGQANKLIAYDLDLAEATISARLRLTYARLGACSRFDMIRLFGSMTPASEEEREREERERKEREQRAQREQREEREQREKEREERAPMPPPLCLRAARVCEDRILLRFPALVPSWPEHFTGAEREIAIMIAGGATNHQIAERRATSVRTVTNQVLSLFRKANVGARAALVAHLYRSSSRPCCCREDQRHRSATTNLEELPMSR